MMGMLWVGQEKYRLTEPEPTERGISRVGSLAHPYIRVLYRTFLMRMSDEYRALHGILRGLLWGVVGIITALFVLLFFAIALPVALRAFVESSSLSESMREIARALAGSLGGIVSAVFILLVLAIIISVSASVLPLIPKVRPGKHVRAVDEALDTLKLRYAKGEITKEQFLEMKKTLETGA